MKKRILTLTLVLCMLLSILLVTAMAATGTVEDLLNQLDSTTFNYTYDTQRSPGIPAHAGESFELSSLAKPLSKPGTHFDSYSGSWTLTKLGSYASVKDGVCSASTILPKIVAYVKGTYTDLKEDTILIHELKKGSDHVAYGVVIAFNPDDGYAAFLGDTHDNNSGAGYFLSTKQLDTSKTYTVYANMIATDFVQDIQLSTTGTHSFGSVAAGYAAQTPLSVTVENIGSVVTGDLTIDLSGVNASDFTLSTNEISSIAIGATSPAFTVTPNNSLTAGKYSAIVTVRGGNIARKSFNVTFTVTDALTPAIELNKSNIDFGSATVGYSAAPDAQTVTVTSTGTAATGELAVSVDNTSDFSVSPATIASLNASTESTGKTADITVQPKTGLAVGTYNATVTVRGTGVTSQSFNVKFAVSEAPKPVVALDTTSYTFNLTEGYTVADVTPLTVTISNTGSGAATGLTLASGTSTRGEFAITYQGGTEIPTGESVSFTVKPSSVKTAGTYSDTVVIRGTNFTELVLNLTLTVTAKPAEPVYTPSYAVAAASAEHGTVALSTKNAYAGSAVTVTVTPDEGYALSSLTAATRTGASVALTDLGSGRYRFTMPASDVTVTAAFAAGEKTARFVDVPVGSTFFDAVEWAAAQGITTGTTDTTFSPNVPCSRAQAVTLLYRAVGSPAVSGASGFPDVPAGAYCGSAVTWAVEKGVTTGTTDGLFAPGVNCSRGQIVAFLYRALFAQK